MKSRCKRAMQNKRIEDLSSLDSVCWFCFHTKKWLLKVKEFDALYDYFDIPAVAILSVSL